MSFTCNERPFFTNFNYDYKSRISKKSKCHVFDPQMSTNYPLLELPSFRRLDEMANKQTEQLRKLTKSVQEARQNHDDESVKKLVGEYDDVLERYIPVLMQQAKIYWDLENYKQVRFMVEEGKWLTISAEFAGGKDLSQVGRVLQ